LMIIWIALLLAAIFSSRFVPFAIVVSGVAIALNFRAVELSGYQLKEPISIGHWSRVERFRLGTQIFLSALVVILLLGSAWAGWLQSLPSERRNWTVEPDPSLVRAAEEVEHWYSSGFLNGSQKTVFFANDAEEMFAWLAPQAIAAGHPLERGPKAIAQVRDVILKTNRQAEIDGKSKVAMDPSIACIVLSDPQGDTLLTALQNLIAAENEWKLAYFRGRVFAFVRDNTPLAAHPVDLPLRAFGFSSADRAPADIPSPFVYASHWYDPFVFARPPRSIERDEAVTYLLYEEATRNECMAKGANRFLAAMIASLVGSPMPVLPGWMIDPRVDMLMVAGRTAWHPSEGPPPIPFHQFADFLILTNISADNYLAVRAARRSIAASPNDAAAYEALGQAYLHLLGDQLEASWGERFPALKQLRLIQAAAAFRQAVMLDPTRAMAHLGLGGVYLQKEFLDLALAEFRAYDRLAHLQGQQAKESAERVQTLEQAVESAQKSTEANAANLGTLDRAKLAARNGLIGMALDTLLRSHLAEFGNSGMSMEFQLLLAVGRASEASERDWCLCI
jgi:hypothetical protein